MDGSGRVKALDALRGVIILLMAFDHANGYVGSGKLASELWDPAAPFPDYQGDGWRFLARFITHLSAPGFFLLMGIGMVLFTASRQRAGWTRSRIMTFFALRGFVLILMQFVIENPAWELGGIVPEGITYVGVLFALGAGMIFGSVLLIAPTVLLLLSSVFLLVAPELYLPGLLGMQPISILHRLVAVPGFTDGFLVLYGVVPWLGVVGIGIWLGRNLADRGIESSRWFTMLGVSLIALFSLIRYSGGFGNLRAVEDGDWIGVFNMVKYPPSLAFLSFTLGTLLLWMVGLQRMPERFIRFLGVFGAAPLFFYATHLYLFVWMNAWLPESVSLLPFWLLGVLFLYPFCKIYSRFKRSQPISSLWRLF
jgi:uncharacterized membrane protein